MLRPHHRTSGDGLASFPLGRPCSEGIRWNRFLLPILAAGLSLLLLLLLRQGLVAPALAEEPTHAQPWTFRSQWGWYEGDRVDYYDLGLTKNSTAPVYRLVDDTGAPIEGQHLIFADLRLGVLVGPQASVNYSDFHRIWDVNAPSGYVPNEVRSLEEIVARGWQMTERSLVWNTPMVPKGSNLVGTDSGDHPLLQGWWNGTDVYYLRFETSADTPGLFDTTREKVREARVTTIFDPPGQLDVLDTYPGDPTYTPLSRPHTFIVFRLEYISDTVRSTSEVEALSLEHDWRVLPSNQLYNHPVVGGRTVVPRFQHGEPANFQKLEAWWNETSKVLYWDLGPVPNGTAPIYRFVSPEGAEFFQQHLMVDVVAPGTLVGDVDSEGYRPIWRIHDIVVEDVENFQTEIIKSMDDVRDMGYEIRATEELMLAPMVPEGSRFLPEGSNPPGGSLQMVWYRGIGVYLAVLSGPQSEDALIDPASQELRSTDLVVIVDDKGQPKAQQKPILMTLPDMEGYTPVWSIVHASGGEGFRPDRFRNVSTLLGRGWTLLPAEQLTAGAFLAGPTNVPAWRPENFTFYVGPVVDDEGKTVKGAKVRVSREFEVIENTTDSQGMAGFDVPYRWNDQTLRVIVSKDGYVTVDLTAEIEDYEHFEPSGGSLPELVSEDSDEAIPMSLLYGVAILAHGGGGRSAPRGGSRDGT
jgi:hypothetical protein